MQLKNVCTVCACEVHLYRKVNGGIPCEYWQDWRETWRCAYDVKRHKKVLESCGFIFKLIDHNLKIIPHIFGLSFETGHCVWNSLGRQPLSHRCWD